MADHHNLTPPPTLFRPSGDLSTPPPTGSGELLPSPTTKPKKPRGRPPGSKNKPKPPVVITRDISSSSSMQTLVLEVDPGADAVSAVAAFARRRRVGVSVLSGTGSVSNVALRHPSSPSAAVTLHGRFDILSLSGAVLPSSSSSSPQAAPTWPEMEQRSVFTVSLAGTQGQVIGGTVAGELTTAGPVVLVVAAFGSAEYHRLPLPEVKEEEVEPVAGAGDEEELVAPPPMSPMPPEMVLWVSPPPPPPPSSSSRARAAVPHHAHY